MRKLHGAIAVLVTVASVMLPTVQTSAHPIEPDYPCYMRTMAGKLVDLTASLCAVRPFVATQASGRIVPNTGDATVPDNANRYDPRYRSVRIETRGGLTRTISGGAGDDLSDARDRATVISPGIGSYGPTYRRNGNCIDANDRAADGSLCGGRAANERPGGQY